jgi:glycerol kinase
MPAKAQSHGAAGRGGRVTHILAIDQGTTSTRALVFDRELRVVAQAQREFPQHYPASGWVEHDPEDLWTSTVETCREAVERVGAERIAAIGIANQRETTLIWERATGRPIANAIVWQDRRTAPICAELKAAGHEPLVTERSGLLLDPYFSGTKAAWLLDHVDGARARAERGELAFGTVDSWLIWRLTGGERRGRHVTDATNASRTLLYDIRRGCWDEELCRLLRVPIGMLPEVLDTAADFGSTDLLGRPVPILGVAGDQQAATIGQACFRPGMVKSTYGTGCFAVLNTGEAPVASANRLLTTIAYRLDGRTTYALEGAIFVAGAAVQWLRDGLKLIGSAAETSELAARSDESQQVYLVPAFVGLAAPHWDAECRGAIFGLTRATGPAELARAALESVGYQTRDLMDAMRRDWRGDAGTVLRVDGGMAASDWAMQFLADICDAPVDRPPVLETTALGAAWLAGMRAGLYPDADAFAQSWRSERRFAPDMDEAVRARKLAGWQDAVRRTLSTF